MLYSWTFVSITMFKRLLNTCDRHKFTRVNPMFITVSNPVQFSISMQLSVACRKFCCLSNQAPFVVCFAPDRSWKILVQLQWKSMADEVVSVQCLSEVSVYICSLPQTSTTQEATFGQHMRMIEVKLEMGPNLR